MELVGGYFEKWQPFCIRDESAMALSLKMFVMSYSIIVPNFKFVSQSARFGQTFTATTPTMCVCVCVWCVCVCVCVCVGV